MGSIESNETIDVFLPQGLVGWTVTEAIVSPRKDGVRLSPISDIGKVSYQSSFHTRKKDGIWVFNARISTATEVLLSLPQNVKVVRANPSPAISVDEAIILSWSDLQEETIEVSYVFEGGSAPAITLSRLPTSYWWIGGLVLMLLVLGASMLMWRRSKTRSPKPASPPSTVSTAQENILRAANPNESKVLSLVLQNNGNMKRNRLERLSELSKSSLASSLNNLEKKNLVTINRSFHVHYVSLSDWFKNL